MIKSVYKYATGRPGVIVANQSLMYIARMVAAKRATAKTPTLIILDEAHKLVDVIFTPMKTRFVAPSEVQAGASPQAVLSAEEKGLNKALEQAYARLYDATAKRDVRGTRAALRKIRALKNYRQELGMYAELIAADPSAFVVDTYTDPRHAYIRVVKSRRAAVLRNYLLSAYPNTQFVLLTATGNDLAPAADTVVRADDVIPPKNRQLLYVPVGRLSQSAVKEKTRSVYRSLVAPTIVAQYNLLAPVLQDIYKIDRVRAIVHEVAKTRAVYLARAIAERGHRVLLYAGTEKDCAQLDGDVAADYEYIQRADNVSVIHSLEKAVAEFKENREYTFFVAVALDTGHDFDEDDIMLQWITKIPFPPLGDIDYLLIEQHDGKDARQKQYIRDTLLTLIQMAGRTTRKPEQFSVTLVLDAALEMLLVRACEYGFADEVRSLAPRLVVPRHRAGWLQRLPDDIRGAVKLV